ncbi:glycosyltransferase family 1 protein, partial [Candidatus Berkelbacteria bacterium]|nr:glycosyltransferase family 1 protein [Candidatus Berkelbacteria bacterium]
IVTDAWHPQINGVVRIYEHIISQLQKEGHRIKVIGPPDFPINLPIPFYREINFAIAPHSHLVKLIDEFAPESIHIATEGPLGFAAQKYCLKRDIPFTTAYHTEYAQYISKRIAKLAPQIEDWSHEKIDSELKKFHARASATMVTNKVIRAELLKRGYIGQLKVILPGVDLALFKPGKKTKFESLTRPVALYVGRIAFEKNLEDFLEMKWEGSKVLVGQGPDLAKLKGVHPEVIFLGKKTGRELAEYYRSADVFVFPSKTDTFGLVMIEALASGIPVAAYNVVGPKNIITESFLGSLGSNLEKSALRALDSGNAKQRHQYIEKTYSWTKAAEEFLNLCQLASIKK